MPRTQVQPRVSGTTGYEPQNSVPFGRAGSQRRARRSRLLVRLRLEPLFLEPLEVGVEACSQLAESGEEPFPCRCRANMAHVRQTRPDPGLGLSRFSDKSL